MSSGSQQQHPPQAQGQGEQNANSGSSSPSGELVEVPEGVETQMTMLQLAFERKIQAMQEQLQKTVDKVVSDHKSEMENMTNKMKKLEDDNKLLTT